MPRGIPNAPDGVGYVFVLIIVFAIMACWDVQKWVVNLDDCIQALRAN